MKRLLRLAPLAVLLIVTSAVLAAPRAVVATLTLPFDTTLPGVPFDMTVRLTNVSGNPIAVGTSARLMVSLADGTKISSDHPHILDPRVPANGPSWIELAANESREFTIDWHESTPSLFDSPQFSGPGVYEVSLELAGAMTPSNYVGTIVTNTAQLTRSVPAGEDEELWRRMALLPDGKWADDSFVVTPRGRQLLKEIILLHPASGYYPYALLLEWQAQSIDRSSRTPTPEDIARARETAERFESSPAYPHLLVLMGDLAKGIANHSWWSHDSATAIKYFALAETYYSDALKKAPIVTIRALAERGRDQSRASVEHERARLAGSRD